MISPEERATCTRWVQSAFGHLESGDAAGLVTDLEGLRETFVYSNYDFYHKWEEAKPRIARLLFQELAFDQFVEVLTLAKRNFYPFHILTYLDEIADEISLSQLMVLCQRFRFPRAGKAPNLTAKLAQAPGEEVTLWLRQAVDGYFQGGDFQQIGFYELNHSLSVVLEILARRHEATALSLCSDYLRKHRFGTKGNGSTHALLDGLATQRTDESRQLLLSLLHDDTPPSELRISVLAKTAAFAPRETVLAALSDLQSALDTPMRRAYLYWFWCNGERLEMAAQEVMPQIDMASWDLVSRATLIDVWQGGYLTWPTSPSFSTRAIFSVTTLFEKLRPGRGSCLTLLFAFFTLGGFYLWLLNRLVGPPPLEWRWLETTPSLSGVDMFLWLIIWTMFAGGEFWAPRSDRQMLDERWKNAASFFGWALLFLGGCLSLRIWALWG